MAEVVIPECGASGNSSAAFIPMDFDRRPIAFVAGAFFGLLVVFVVLLSVLVFV